MLKVTDLSIGYRGRTVLSALSFELASGECVLLRGSNGSGKTTLLKTLAGLIPPLGGTVECGTVAMVPTGIPKVKGFTARDFVATSTWRRAVSERENAKITGALEMMGVAHKADSDISSLSDGEFQKVCIAAALSRKADVILLDEPTAFLDVESRIALMKLLKELSRSGRTILFSSHDIYDAERFCDRTITI